ncbi:MAG: ROK family protein [Candidatus Aenigmatarchaeota archaeon]
MATDYIAAVDIGGTKITATLANKEGILTKIYQPTKKEGDNLTVPRQVDSMVEYSCGRIGAAKSDICAVGISTCSPFEQRGSERVVVTPNLCGGLAKERGVIPNDWMEIPLEQHLRNLYKSVTAENDCVSAAVAEHTFGNLRGVDNGGYVTVSTGIGMGFYVDGKIIRGKNGNAGHGGHMFIVEKGRQCGCGNYGDLEAVASGTAMALDYAELAEIDPESVDAKKVFSRYRDGDKHATNVVKRAARNLARGLASVAALLDTHVFVLGGSVMNDRDIFLPLVKEEFYKAFPALTRGVEFREPGLGKYLGDMAALSLVMPEDWVTEWLEKRPWERAPEAEVLA